jgi:hypothetical protein
MYIEPCSKAAQIFVNGHKVKEKTKILHFVSSSRSSSVWYLLQYFLHLNTFCFHFILHTKGCF